MSGEGSKRFKPDEASANSMKPPSESNSYLASGDYLKQEQGFESMTSANTMNFSQI